MQPDASIIDGCLSEWEICQAVAEWLGGCSGAPVVGLYLTEGPDQQVLRGLYHPSDQVGSLPDRLWWRGGGGWTSLSSPAFRAVPFSSGDESGTVVLGPFHRESDSDLGPNVDILVHRAVPTLVQGLHRFRRETDGGTPLLVSVAEHLGRSLDGSPSVLTDALRDELLARSVKWEGGLLITDGAQRQAPLATEVATFWLRAVDAASDPSLRTRLVLWGLAHLVDARSAPSVGRGTRLAETARRLGTALDLPVDQVAEVAEAAHLLRVGAVVMGTGLTDGSDGPDPRSLVAVSAALLRGAGLPASLVEAVAASEQHWDCGWESSDGEGRPLPVAAAILAVARAWMDEGMGAVIDGSGSRFDPAVTAAFLRVRRELLSVVG